MQLHNDHSGQNPSDRDGHDELRAPFARISQLRDNLFAKVPRQNQDVIRLSFSEELDRVDRDVTAWKKPSLFVRVPINRKIQEVSANAAVVQERISFSGRPVSSYRFPL